MPKPSIPTLQGMAHLEALLHRMRARFDEIARGLSGPMADQITPSQTAEFQTLRARFEAAMDALDRGETLPKEDLLDLMSKIVWFAEETKSDRPPRTC